MRRLLHILSSENETRAREIIDWERAQPDCAVEVGDVRRPEPDYQARLEAGVAADAVAGGGASRAGLVFDPVTNDTRRIEGYFASALYALNARLSASEAANTFLWPEVILVVLWPVVIISRTAEKRLQSLMPCPRTLSSPIRQPQR